MLRSVVVRNEPFLRSALVKAARTNSAVRAFSIQASKFLCLRISSSAVTSKNLTNVQWTTKLIRRYSSYPSHIKVTLPALSPTMEQGTIVSWAKKEGDKLNEGDLLAEIETDKATMGFETPEEGYLAKILISAGSKDIPIGKLMCIIVENQDDVAAFKDFKDDGAAAAKPVAAVKPSTAQTTSAPPIVSPPPEPSVTPSSPKIQTAVEQRGERVYASPMAKKLAEAQQLRLEGKGSGVFESIKTGDLAGMATGKKPVTEGAPKSLTGPGGYIDIPVTSIRTVIATRLLESKQQVPHYYVSVDCQVDKLMKLREKVNKKLEKQKMRVSINDFIIKATAIACYKVPESNSYWMGTVIRQFENVDVSVAVSTERGLITPIIFSADRKGVVDISNEVKALAAKARANKLQPHEFQGGTVSVSNLGMYGVSNFCAVINPPQSCILAVGGTFKKLVVDENSPKGFREVNTMTVTLSADHRTVDGAVAAKWLGHFRDFIEDPANMIL